jgi:hypothetical protein
MEYYFRATPLFNIGNAKAHQTLILIGLPRGKFRNCLTAAELTATPARLTCAIGKQTALANSLRGKDLIFH